MNTLASRAAFVAMGALSIIAAFFVTKWGFANTAARLPESIDVAALAAYLAPDDPQTHYALAVLSEKTFVPEDLQKALAEFEAATALSPNNYLLWLGLGRARERTGDQAGAERALRKALELAPAYSRVQWTLGNALLRQGKTEEAFTEIRKAVAGDAGYTDAAAAMAWQVLDEDIVQVRNAIGDSARLNGALAKLLAEKKRFDESFDIWNTLGSDEKKTFFQELAETLSRLYADGGKYRYASQLADKGEPPENLQGLIGRITNGGFENPVKTQNAGIFDWRIEDGTSPRIGPTDGQKRSGNYSLLISFAGGGKDFRGISQTVAVEPGKIYALALFYRSELKTTDVFKWQIVDPLAGKLITEKNLLPNTSDWTILPLNFTVSENTDGVRIRLVREGCDTSGCAVSGNLWFDDFTLTSQ